MVVTMESENIKEEISDEDFEKTTRKVFNEHHREQAGDDRIFKRLTSLISTDYFQVPPDFFKNKIVLDVGCGSNANASYAFLALGAKRVYAVDMGNKWQDCARKKLKEFGEDKFTLKNENVLNLSFEDGVFDFVHCAGVLHHTKDPKKGFLELARVTKKEGRTFITIMANADGIIYQWINLLRERYKMDEQFRQSVDNLTNEKIQESADWILEERKKQGEGSEEERTFFKGLFDNDLVLTIKDRLQAPTYHNFDFTEKQIREWFEEGGLENVQRITRYTKDFKNLRRFFAPMYYHYKHPMSILLFGEGYIQMIGIKK